MADASMDNASRLPVRLKWLTESTTIVHGKPLFYPQNLPPDARIHVPPTAATVPDSPPPRKKPRHVPAPGSNPTSQPQRQTSSLKILSIGPKQAPITRTASQPQPSRVAHLLPQNPRGVNRIPPPAVPAGPARQQPRQSAQDSIGSQSKQQRKPVVAPPPGRVSQSAGVGHGVVVANASRHASAGHKVDHCTQVSANASGHRAPRQATGSGARTPPAHADNVSNSRHLRNPPSGQEANSRRQPRPSTPSDIEGEVEAVMNEAEDAPNLVNPQGMPLNPGVAIMHNNKPTLASFSPETHPTVRFTRRRSKAKVIAIGSYSWAPGDAGEKVPSIEEIVTQAFAVASQKMRSNYPFLMEHVLLVEIVVRTERSNIKRSLEGVVVCFFGFASNPAFNQRRSREILPNGFHDLQTPNGVVPFGHPYIREACRVAVFDGRLSLGIQYPNYFNPISWRFLAFIGAITNHIIHSWRDGHYKRENLDTTQQLPVFRRYLEILEEMHERQPNRLAELCGSIHDEARTHYEQTLERSPPPDPPVRWAPDTGERYVSRVAKQRSASECLAADERPDAEDGDGFDAGDQVEHARKQDSPSRDSQQTAKRRTNRTGAAGPSQSQHAAGYESQTAGAGPSHHQHRQRDDTDDSDNLPSPQQVHLGRGAARSADDQGQNCDDGTAYHGGWDDKQGGQPGVDPSEVPDDAEAVEFPDEQERDVVERTH